MGDLERDTQLDGGSGRYRAYASEAWERAPGRPTGGFLAALALRAAGETAELPRPVSFTGSFIGPADFGPVEIEVSKLFTSDQTAALRVSMTQSEAPILEGLVWTAADELPGYAVEFAPIPEYPGPEGLPSVTEIASQAGRPMPRAWSGIDFRSRWTQPGESGAPREPRVLSWHRFRPRANFLDPFLDAARSLVLIEATALGPLLFNAGGCITEVPYSASCLDLSLQIHRDTRKADWLMVEACVPSASAGVAHVDHRCWSPDGSLLVSAHTSMLCRPRPMGDGVDA